MIERAAASALLVALSLIASPRPAVAESTAAFAHGRVVDESGAPIPGARVVAIPSRARSGVLRGLSRPMAERWTTLAAVTAADGSFELAPPAEPWFLLVGAEARALRAVDVPALDPAANRFELGEIALPEGRRLAGRVVQPDGKPIHGATLRVAREFEPGSWVAPAGFPERAITDADGRFEVRRIPAGGGLVFGVDAEGSAPAIGRTEGDADPAEVEVVLEPGATVTGRLLALDGSPVGGTRVTASARRPENDSGEWIMRLTVLPKRWARTDVDGRFVLTGLGCDATQLAVWFGDEDEPRANAEAMAPACGGAPEPIEIRFPAAP